MKKRDIVGSSKDKGVIPEGRDPPISERKTKGSPHDDSVIVLEREGEEGRGKGEGGRGKGEGGRGKGEGGRGGERGGGRGKRENIYWKGK